MPKATKATANATDATATDNATDNAANNAARIANRLAKTATTVQANATNFEQYSNRDNGYLAYFGRVMRANGGKATLAQLQAAGTPAPTKSDPNRTIIPDYIGSAKSTDAGAINRLRKAGYITATPDGQTFTPTAQAKTHKAFIGKA